MDGAATVPLVFQQAAVALGIDPQDLVAIVDNPPDVDLHALAFLVDGLLLVMRSGNVYVSYRDIRDVDGPERKLPGEWLPSPALVLRMENGRDIRFELPVWGTLSAVWSFLLWVGPICRKTHSDADCQQ